MASDGSHGNVLVYLQYLASFPDWETSGALAAQYPEGTVRPDRSTALKVMIYITGALVLTIVPARIFIRARSAAFGPDDWLIIPAFFSTLGLTISQLLLVEMGGMGRHVLFNPYESLKHGQKLEFVAFMTYYGAVLFTKLSITFFLRRLFSPMTFTRTIIIYGTMAFYILLFTFSTSLYLFSCKPIAASWDLDTRVHGYYFLNISSIVLSTSILYAIGDLWLLLLPIYTVLQLSLNWQRKVGLIFVFSLGGFACAGVVLKCFYVTGLYKSYDPTWNGIGYVYGCQIESVFGIVSASLPALHSTFVARMPKRLQRWYNCGNCSPIFSYKETRDKSEPGSNATGTTTAKQTASTTLKSFWTDPAKPFSLFKSLGDFKGESPNSGITKEMTFEQTVSESEKPVKKPGWPVPKIDMPHVYGHVSPSTLERIASNMSTGECGSETDDSVWVIQDPQDEDLEAGNVPRRPSLLYSEWCRDSVSRGQKNTDC